MAIISDYLPAGLSDAEIDQAIDDAVSSSGAASVKDMGSVMAILKPALTGRADLSDVSRRVKARLGT